MSASARRCGCVVLGAPSSPHLTTPPRTHPSSFYGIAIGFVVAGGAAAVSPISGGCLCVARGRVCPRSPTHSLTHLPARPVPLQQPCGGHRD